jgi:hypothetical protein
MLQVSLTSAIQSGKIPMWILLTVRSRLAGGGVEVKEYLAKTVERTNGETRSLRGNSNGNC